MKIKDYPANLIAACKDQKIRKLAEIRIAGKELEGAVEYVIDILATKNLRNADILRKRFQENMTLRQIAELYGLSTERVRQIITECIFRITRPENWEIICYGYY